jgi:hypothetical protein
MQYGPAQSSPRDDSTSVFACVQDMCFDESERAVIVLSLELAAKVCINHMYCGSEGSMVALN